MPGLHSLSTHYIHLTNSGGVTSFYCAEGIGSKSGWIVVHKKSTRHKHPYSCPARTCIVRFRLLRNLVKRRRIDCIDIECLSKVLNSLLLILPFTITHYTAASHHATCRQEQSGIKLSTCFCVFFIVKKFHKHTKTQSGSSSLSAYFSLSVAVRPKPICSYWRHRSTQTYSFIFLKKCWVISVVLGKCYSNRRH